MKPLCIELFAGTFGWSQGWLEMGGRVVGFDIEHLPHHGPVPAGADLVIQDIRTVHGSQFKDASLLLASPPCTEFSYLAMPWSRAKQIGRALRGEDEFPEGYKGSRTISEMTALFDACFRIQLEAIEAAGHFIPLVVENVRGAQPWVGRGRASFGSFVLWGDVPALMPIVKKPSKNRGGSWFNIGSPGQKETGRNPVHEAQKTIAHVNKRDGHGHTRHLTNQREHDAVREGSKHGGDWFSDPTSPGRQGGVTKAREGTKQAGISVPRRNGKGNASAAWFQDGADRHGSKSNARKAASAQIARIPGVLARHIARAWHPAV